LAAAAAPAGAAIAGHAGQMTPVHTARWELVFKSTVKTGQNH